MGQFYQLSNPSVDNELKQRVLRLSRRMLRHVPEHFELLAGISPRFLEDFLQYNIRILKITKLSPDFFAFLRYLTALKQGFDYCQKQNFEQLKHLGYSAGQILPVLDFNLMPFEKRLTDLAQVAYKAVFLPDEFTSDDVDLVVRQGISVEVVYWVIDHVGVFEKNMRILKAFFVK